VNYDKNVNFQNPFFPQNYKKTLLMHVLLHVRLSLSEITSPFGLSWLGCVVLASRNATDARDARTGLPLNRRYVPIVRLNVGTFFGLKFIYLLRT